MDKNRLTKIKTKLVKRRQEISLDVDRFICHEFHLGREMEISGPPDDTVRQAEQELAWLATEMMFRELIEIEEALQKLKRGNYGICAYCSKPIQYKRLITLPHAKLCLGCQRKKESFTDRLAHRN